MVRDRSRRDTPLRNGVNWDWAHIHRLQTQLSLARIFQNVIMERWVSPAPLARIRRCVCQHHSPAVDTVARSNVDILSMIEPNPNVRLRRPYHAIVTGNDAPDEFVSFTTIHNTPTAGRAALPGIGAPNETPPVMSDATRKRVPQCTRNFRVKAQSLPRSPGNDASGRR